MALLDLNFTYLESLGVIDGRMHEVKWEMRIAAGCSRRIRMWIDDVLVGESTTTERITGWMGMHGLVQMPVDLELVEGAFVGMSRKSLGPTLLVPLFLPLWSGL